MVQIECDQSNTKKYPVCIISCKNRQGVKPINDDRVIALCKCNSPPKTSYELDGKCHWRVGGSKLVDVPQLEDDYIKNWYCTDR